jgi:transcriptional regulator with XRE-family HTH domain
MARPVRIHQPPRFHYIPEWAERRNVSQADIVRGVGADKSTVSRWFEGSVPSAEYLIALTGFLEAGEPAALFRHPDDDWMARLLRGRSGEERARIEATIRATIENAFPRKEVAA